MTDNTPSEIFAVELAALAREIAMDIFPIETILAVHKLTEAEWAQIQTIPKFQEMLNGLIIEWNSADSTRARVRVKAATGLEMQLEQLIRDAGDPDIPLGQRTEAFKFLARIGEIDTTNILAGGGGGGFNITLNIGQQVTKVTTEEPMTIEHEG